MADIQFFSISQELLKQLGEMQVRERIWCRFCYGFTTDATVRPLTGLCMFAINLPNSHAHNFLCIWGNIA